MPNPSVSRQILQAALLVAGLITLNSSAVAAAEIGTSQQESREPHKAIDDLLAPKSFQVQLATYKRSQNKSTRVTYRKTKRPSVPLAPTFGQIAGLHQDKDALGLKTGSALVIDANTQEIVYEKNGNAILPIASITKLMTAFVVAGSGASMDEMLTISNEDIDTEKGSTSRLAPGARLSRKEMLHLALMSSENRAASALARSHPQGRAAFIEQMNLNAANLGMTSTRYVDSTGLSSKNQSSAIDLAKLVGAASKVDFIKDYSTRVEDTVRVGKRTMRYKNTNSLVRNTDWEILLQKTGYISEAGRCVVMELMAAGRKLIFVILDSANIANRVNDAKLLRDFAIHKTGTDKQAMTLVAQINAEPGVADALAVDSPEEDEHGE